jgi:hypothetical protein
VVLALAGVSNAAGPAGKIKASKHEDGPYSGGTTTDHMSVGETQDYFFKVVNRRDDRQAFSLESGVPEAPGYDRTWFKGNKDITTDVTTDGYEFEIGKSAKIFRVQVTRSSGGDSQCIDGHLDKGSSQIDVALIAINDGTVCL